MCVQEKIERAYDALKADYFVLAPFKNKFISSEEQLRREQTEHAELKHAFKEIHEEHSHCTGALAYQTDQTNKLKAVMLLTKQELDEVTERVNILTSSESETVRHFFAHLGREILCDFDAVFNNNFPLLVKPTTGHTKQVEF
jgi:hypothetical protein